MYFNILKICGLKTYTYIYFEKLQIVYKYKIEIKIYTGIKGSQLKTFHAFSYNFYIVTIIDSCSKLVSAFSLLD